MPSPPKQEFHVGQTVLVTYPTYHFNYEEPTKTYKVDRFHPEDGTYLDHYILSSEDGSTHTALPGYLKAVDITEQFSKVKV